MKGLLKGLRYFSHMFEEEKEPEIQIGAPTDVKHVAHIGWDGPSSVETPSWMKEFKTSGGFESASIGAPPGNSSRVDEGNKSTRDLPDVPKSSRQTSQDPYSQSPSRETSTKSKQSKRIQSKESSEGSKSILEPDQSPSRNPTEGGKKSRRKKSKESINVGPSKSSRSNKANSSNSTRERESTMSPDPGPPGQPILGSDKTNNDIYQNSSSSSGSKPIYTRGNEDKW